MQDTIKDLTPMMQQYFAMKQAAPDCILFFRMGDFYEIFGEDALTVAPKLEIVLTSREKGGGQKIPFCGVPHHSARGYWLKLLALGFKVAIADQVEDPALSKGLVRREVTKVYTPGCVDDLDALVSHKPNYLIAVYEDPEDRQVSVVALDFSTGEFRSGLLGSLAELGPLLSRFRPRELLARRFFHTKLQEAFEAFIQNEGVVLSALSEGTLRDEKEQYRLCEEVFGAFPPQAKERPLVGAVLSHLESLRLSSKGFRAIRPLIDPDIMMLSEVTRRDLELFETVRRRSEQGSLFYDINRTLTPMGARFLRYALLNPLIDAAAIQTRQRGARFFVEHPEVLRTLREQWANAPDLTRIVTRLVTSGVQPGELAKLRLALVKLQEGASILGQTGAEIGSLAAEELAPAGEIVALINAELVENPSALGSDLNVFRLGFDREFDVLRQRALHGEEATRTYEATLREATGIQSLKIKGHKSYGLLIEVTKSNLNKIPSSFVRRQTMVNNERFVTDELMELDEQLGAAMEHAIGREEALYQKLLAKVAARRADLARLGERAAYWDVLQSFAFKAVSDRWALPELATDGVIDLQGSRHPVVEAHIGRHAFEPNDVLIEPASATLLITGPNMGGKSTLMRQVALAAILHQIGSFVPCHGGKLPLFDAVHTRVGASDDLAQGQSTFMVEMAEMAAILRHASGKSLVILDEVGRGTSTTDGMAIALAILEDLTFRVGCPLLFSTHFHELTARVAAWGQVRLMQVEVEEEERGIRFTHRIVAGAADRSFGIEVAKIAGVPSPVIKKAESYLASPPLSPASPLVSPPPRGLVVSPGQEEEPDLSQILLAKVMSANLNKTTPFQALKLLHDLQEQWAARLQVPLFQDEIGIGGRGSGESWCQ